VNKFCSVVTSLAKSIKNPNILENGKNDTLWSMGKEYFLTNHGTKRKITHFSFKDSLSTIFGQGLTLLMDI
jgi:hypothetical protein